MGHEHKEWWPRESKPQSQSWTMHPYLNSCLKTPKYKQTRSFLRRWASKVFHLDGGATKTHGLHLSRIQTHGKQSSNSWISRVFREISPMSMRSASFKAQNAAESRTRKFVRVLPFTFFAHYLITDALTCFDGIQSQPDNPVPHFLGSRFCLKGLSHPLWPTFCCFHPCNMKSASHHLGKHAVIVVKIVSYLDKQGSLVSGNESVTYPSMSSSIYPHLTRPESCSSKSLLDTRYVCHVRVVIFCFMPNFVTILSFLWSIRENMSQDVKLQWSKIFITKPPHSGSECSLRLPLYST